MKLGEIIRYLEKTTYVVLWQTNVYIGKEDNSEMVFEGAIMDIPWFYLDFFLDNDIEGEAIDAQHFEENGKIGFVISIKEGED